MVSLSLIPARTLRSARSLSRLRIRLLFLEEKVSIRPENMGQHIPCIQISEEVIIVVLSEAGKSTTFLVHICCH
ncbi:hypothetical protein ACE6H2_006383 [Prunus campanulata]